MTKLTELQALVNNPDGLTITQLQQTAGVSKSTAYRWISTLGIQVEGGKIPQSDIQDLVDVASGKTTAPKLAAEKAQQAQTQQTADAMGTDVNQAQTAMMGAVGQQVLQAGVGMGRELSPLFWQGVEVGLIQGQVHSAQGFLGKLGQESNQLTGNVRAMVGAFSGRAQGGIIATLAQTVTLAIPPSEAQRRVLTDNF